MRAVILAGGVGARLRPYTISFPKPLMPLGDMPVIEIVLRQLASHGVDRATLAVGHLAELLTAFLGDGARFGLAVDYAREDEPLGTAGPLRGIADLPETFLVMNGDLLTTLDYGALLQTHHRAGNAVTVAIRRREVAIDFGVLECDARGRLSAYHEKPSITHDVSMGAYVFEREALDWIPAEGPFDFPELIQALLAAGRPVGTHRHEGLWLDIGRPEDYEAAQRIFEERREEFLPVEA